MCGIFGIWRRDEQPLAPQMLQCATTILRHRGPDDEGYCLINTQSLEVQSYSGQDTVPELSYPFITSSSAADFDIAFAHRRLAILDLSPAGHQPMCSVDGSCWIIYNGEIYNYLELRQELRTLGYTFRTNTDTEVILAAYQAWGEECLRRFNGMWAFAVWDSRRRCLFCARDRFGIKPFYYYFDGQQFCFASEIKAILANPRVPRRPNDDLIFDYLAYNRLDHTSGTLFKQIFALPPAHYLVLNVDELQNRTFVELTPRRYWDLNPEYRINGWTDNQYASRFYELLEDSIRLRLRSDVSIGTCLSGGLDSSSIVCTVNDLLRKDGVDQRLIGQRQKTFSSCFDDKRFDEREYIAEVLAATGAEQNYVFPDGQRLIEELSQIVWHQDEPFGSTSVYAQWNVFRLVAERGVTVVLDGQGGDELLAGYLLYYPYYHLDLLARGSWKRFWNEWQQARVYHNHAPRSSLRTLFSIGTSAWLTAPKERIKQLLGRSGERSYAWLDRDFIRSSRTESKQMRKFNNLFGSRLYQGLSDGLCRLLRYEDRNSMAFSVESRVPFLDYRLSEYVFALPDDQKIRSGLTKFVLREAMKGVIPEKVRLRTDKMGFVTPEAIWFQNHLAPLAKEVLYSAPRHTKAYFDLAEVDRLIDEAVQEGTSSGASNVIWRILNLCLWFDAFHVGQA